MKPDDGPAGGALRIDFIALEQGGAIGMTHCPGRSGPDRRGRVWRRELPADVRSLREAGIDLVLTLLGDAELGALGAADLGARLREAGIRWIQCPIEDFGVPDEAALRAWPTIEAQLAACLAADARVLVHCAAGLGRTGTMVALLLRGLGSDPEAAIARVRAARPGTIETPAQVAFVRGDDR